MAKLELRLSSLTGGSGRCALFLLRSVSITKPHRAPTHTHILTQSMIHQSLHSMEVHTKVDIRIWKSKSMYSRDPNKHVALLFYFRKFFPLTIRHNKQSLFFHLLNKFQKHSYLYVHSTVVCILVRIQPF